MARFLGLLLLLITTTAEAQMIRFEPSGPPSPAFGGRGFGNIGAYERIAGRATIAVDPADRRNAVIADIALAPRNAEGRVEATADIIIFRPADPARGNGTLFVEAVNRGRMLALPLFHDTATARLDREPGNGFLFAQGYAVAFIGWQADFTPNPGELAIRLPILAGTTGELREEVVFDHRRSPVRLPLAFPVADPGSARLTMRNRWDQPRETPPGLALCFPDANAAEITRPEGSDAGAIYELTYTARDPAISGLGFAAFRDITSFLRHEPGAANPLAGRVQRALAFGVSQSGRYLRDFLYLGFNEDMAGRPVFEGVMPHVAGSRRLNMNSRFARADKAPRHPQDPAWRADAFPFTYAETQNPFTGARDSLLARCTATNTCPRVMQTDTEYEYWGAHASLVTTDPQGNPIALPAHVRAYMLAGTPHFAPPPGVAQEPAPACALPLNPTHNGGPMRALLTALDLWARENAAPPDSAVPSRAAGTLVDAARALPAPIPGLPYAGLHVPAAESDHGVMPPREIGRFPVFVPQLDADGMAVAGIRAPALAAPVATLTGWNPRAEGFGAGVLCPLQGAMLPFAATRAAREAAGDPRLSLAERYPNAGDREAAMRAAAARLVAARLLLAGDAP